MKKSEIKKILKSNMIYENDSLESIKEQCKNVSQFENAAEPQYLGISEAKGGKKPLRILKPILLGMGACAIAAGAFFLGTVDYSTLEIKNASSIYLDVNPSVEIKVHKNRVIETVANNEDGETILEHIHLKGVDIETALYAVVGSMYTNGFLNEDKNSILVSVDNNHNDTSILLDDITNQIQNIFKDNEGMDCSIIGQNVQNDEELKALADQYGISIGKLKLILKIIEASEVYTEENIEELAQLSIKELDIIYKSLFNKDDDIDDDIEDDDHDDDDDDDDDVNIGNPNGFIDKKDAINLVLTHLGITEQDVEFIKAEVLFNKGNKKENEMVYLVSLMYKETREIERYIVDCSTGEIVSEDVIEDWFDNIPDDGGHFGSHRDDEDEPKDPNIPEDEDNEPDKEDEENPFEGGEHPDKPHEEGGKEPPFEH